MAIASEESGSNVVPYSSIAKQCIRTAQSFLGNQRRIDASVQMLEHFLVFALDRRHLSLQCSITFCRPLVVTPVSA